MESVVQEGEILAGKYRVDRVLGVGGMGVVVAAHHLELDSKVAIKFLLPETLGNPDAVTRFAREARAAVKIRSEHVARISDVGKLENGAPYMVMEFLQGIDLAGWLSERGPLPIEQAVEFALQASEAIAEAHALGIVHRDLKPANLFVVKRADGGLSVKVLDFGISKMTSLSGSGGEGSMTRTSTMLGSPIYMSPEQIQSSKDVDARGDIWALGVILYEVTTGSPPFGGEHMAELIYAIISAPPPPMKRYRPDIPEAFERVILRCLAKARGDRFSSIAEMARALLPFAPARSLASVERIAGVTTGASPAPDQTVATAPAWPIDSAAIRPESAGTQASWGNTNQRPEGAPAMSAATTVAKTGRAWLALSAAGAAVLVVGGLLAAQGLITAETAASAPPPAMSALSPPVPIASPAELIKPEPTLPSATVTAVVAAPPPSASSTSRAKASAASAVSTRAKSSAQVKSKQSTPATAPESGDLWGGSQQ